MACGGRLTIALYTLRHVHEGAGARSVGLGGLTAGGALVPPLQCPVPWPLVIREGAAWASTAALLHSPCPPGKTGEELTFDYSSVTESEKEFREAICLCSTRNCRRAPGLLRRRGLTWDPRSPRLPARAAACLAWCSRWQLLNAMPRLLCHAGSRRAGAPTSTSPAAAPSSRSWPPSTPSCTGGRPTACPGMGWRLRALGPAPAAPAGPPGDPPRCLLLPPLTTLPAGR